MYKYITSPMIDTKNLRFPGTMPEVTKEEPQRILNKVELNILSQILNSIRKENYFETLMKITYQDGQAVELYNLIDKINELNKKLDTNK